MKTEDFYLSGPALTTRRTSSWLSTTPCTTQTK